jgi:hypothetical protein
LGLNPEGFFNCRGNYSETLFCGYSIWKLEIATNEHHPASDTRKNSVTAS